MKASAYIPHKFPSLNDYIRDCRANRYKGAATKRDAETATWLYIRKMPEFKKPVRVSFIWHERTRKRDLDNIAFAKKFILDALVKSGKLENDDPRHVVGFTDDFVHDPAGDGVLITVEEV